MANRIPSIPTSIANKLKGSHGRGGYVLTEDEEQIADAAIEAAMRAMREAKPDIPNDPVEVTRADMALSGARGAILHF